MQVSGSSHFSSIRRLGTSAAPNVPFHTLYRYYWKDHSGWHPYEEPFLQSIQEAVEGGHTEVTCTTTLYQYQLNLHSGYQRNMDTGTLRPLCHRPVFQPVVLLRPELRTLSGPQELAPLPTPRLDQPYPETWIPLSPTLDFVKVLMAVEDRGYRLIYGLFHKSMPESKYRITSISRIQNPFLWDKYRRKQSYMARKMSADQRLRNERHLFHGTTAASVDAICKHNLDPRLSGKHAAAYGQGSYFARRASYSHRYAPTGEGGLRCLFLAKVMVGKSALGDPSLRRPPPLEPSSPTSDLYDSCVDSLTDPQIYVVFDSDQCYPYFLVHYLEVDTTLRLD
uniref:Poly [ADP-ribose] polymerase n=1 Tax=Sphenodon punctatus TaxID=8508 RepID=A0A8D0HJV2_SPHPU